jgi:O6-methylguanine-DNA--protein-cysteine methyltransferase
MSDFTSRVIAAVRRIPPGRVARAVGNIMRDCRRHDVPCHRVIAAAGKLGGYGGNLALKRALLRAEGLQVSGSTIREFRAKRHKYSRT